MRLVQFWAEDGRRAVAVLGKELKAQFVCEPADGGMHIRPEPGWAKIKSIARSFVVGICRQNTPAHTIPRLDQAETDARAMEAVGGRQAGEPAADDQNAL